MEARTTAAASVAAPEPAPRSGLNGATPPASATRSANDPAADARGGQDAAGGPPPRGAESEADDAPWPSEGEEAAFLAEASGRRDGPLFAERGEGGGGPDAPAWGGEAPTPDAGPGEGTPWEGTGPTGGRARPPGAVSGGEPLPALDDLVARIPGPVRETLDELFRAKFIGVRKYPVPPLGG